MKILIVNAVFYPHLSAMLQQGATDVLQQAGASVTVIEVAGALEIPAVMAFAANHFDGFIALGCVIRGETSHYDIVATQSAASLQYLATRQQLVIGNGILTVENETQAIARAHPDKGNKGAFAAKTCLHLLALKQQWAEKEGGHI